MRTRVAVIGLGYVGLPLVGACIESGIESIGYDLNAELVTGLQTGRSHIDDVSDEDVRHWLESGLQVTSDPDRLWEANSFIICVPTPLTTAGDPDLAAVISAAEVVAKALEHSPKGSLVVLESTTYPGTTDEVLRPILERSGKRAGLDFSLAFSPERVDPGNPEFSIKNTVKLVGGFTTDCTARAYSFYSKFIDMVVTVSGLKEAEMAKLLENTYRHVNIALVNEFVKVCHPLGIDFWEVIRAASTKPYGFQAFFPGPGVGGHCIPIDPRYLSHKVMAELGQNFKFVELASDINSAMPQYVVGRLQELLNSNNMPVKGSRVLILGVTYKRDLADLRESPSYAVVRHLRLLGADVSFHDPYVEHWSVDNQTVKRVASPTEGAANADCVLLLQNHSGYADNLEHLQCEVLLDTRGATSGATSRWNRL